MSNGVKRYASEDQIVRSWNELENRPFYTEESKRTIVENASVTIYSNNITGYARFIDIIPDYTDYTDVMFFKFDPNYLYDIDFNGVKYEKLPVIFRSGYHCLGNLNISSTDYEDTGEPFLIVFMPTNVRYYFYFKEETSACTFSIYEEQVKKLDSKYMNFDYVPSIKSNPCVDSLGHYAFEFGHECEATGIASTTMGSSNQASGKDSVAMGFYTSANAHASISTGNGTVANGAYQLVIGKFNIEDTYDEENKGYEPSENVFIVGNGNSSARSNAHTLDWDGVGWFAGGLKVGGTGQDDEAAVEVALKSDIPTIPDWAKAETKPTYTASEVGADASGTANSVVSTHNTATDAHNDIRLLVTDLTTRLNTLADSDDTTLDQMSEIVAYIKSNKTLIESVTTSKVSVSDIIDNLTTNVNNKPLSAAQGVALKALIDALQTEVNGKALTSDLTSHTGNTSNPHGVTKAQVGLENVDNVKQYSESNPPPYPVTSVNGATGAVTVSAVPDCSADNNGQFLRVVDGVATWTTVLNAEEASF